jgi:hypothetical protein
MDARPILYYDNQGRPTVMYDPYDRLVFYAYDGLEGPVAGQAAVAGSRFPVPANGP